MRVLLINPPATDVCQPGLSLPALTAFLKQKGVEVIQRDINIEAYDYFLSKEYLQRSREIIMQKKRRLEKAGSISKEEYLEYCFSVMAALYGEQAIDNIAQAKSIIRDKRAFYDLSKYLWSFKIINYGLLLVSCGSYPAVLGLNSFIPCNYSKASLQDLNNIAAGSRSNMFYDYFRKKVVKEICQIKPDLIGISVSYLDQLVPCLTLARLIKLAGCKAHITVGGNYITLKKGEIASNPELFETIDSFIVHEGEKPIWELTQQLASGKEFSRVSNLIYRNGRQLLTNNISPPIGSGHLPAPDFSGLQFDKYLTPQVVLPLTMSRRCYWGRCAFCEFALLSGSKLYTERTPAQACAMMEQLSKRYKTKYFSFFDLAMRPANIKELCELILKKGRTFYWSGIFRFDKQLSDNLIDLMARAGCKTILFGLESANQRTLNRMQKGTKTAEISRIIQRCKKRRINIVVTAIIGFPGETLKEAKNTKRFIENNFDRTSPAFFDAFNLKPGTSVFRRAAEYGLFDIKPYGHKDNLYGEFKYKIKNGLSLAEANNFVLHNQFSDRFNFMDPAHRLLYLTKPKWPGRKKDISDKKKTKERKRTIKTRYMIAKGIAIMPIYYNLGLVPKEVLASGRPEALKFVIFRKRSKQYSKNDQIKAEKGCFVWDTKNTKFGLFNSAPMEIISLIARGYSTKEIFLKVRAEHGAYCNTPENIADIIQAFYSIGLIS